MASRIAPKMPKKITNMAATPKITLPLRTVIPARKSATSTEPTMTGQESPVPKGRNPINSRPATAVAMITASTERRPSSAQ